VQGPLGGGPNAYRLTSGSPAINRGRTVTDGLRGMADATYDPVANQEASATFTIR